MLSLEQLRVLAAEGAIDTVVLAFTDSPFTWGGGVITPDGAGSGTDTGTEIDYTHACALITASAN